MYVACMAFHAKVSDPLIGGTYMTLLNTVTNLGGNWPATMALWMVDPLTSKECRGAASQSCGSTVEAAVSGNKDSGVTQCTHLHCLKTNPLFCCWFVCPSIPSCA